MNQNENITRSILLRAPFIILCLIYYENGGKMQEKVLLGYIKRCDSQLSKDLRKLKEKKYILCKKRGREVTIHITPLGINYLTNYTKNVIIHFIDLLDFLVKLNRTDKKAEKELIKIVLREYLNDSDVFPIIDHLNEKFSKLRKILKQKKYYEKIYSETEQGILKDTLIHKVFIFLHQNQDDLFISKQTLYQKFPSEKRSKLSILQKKWENVTFEKYVLPNKRTNKINQE